MPMDTYIMHLDMDAFYASIEQLDNPDYRGKPLVVGMGQRGVVSAASYEARKFGIHSAMPLGKAKHLCPQAIFTPVRMSRYLQVSKDIQKVLHNFSPCVEQASVDEAYLDATGTHHLYPSVLDFAKAVQQAVLEVSGGLSCSLGLAPLKFVAKIASDLKKPGGISLITAAELPQFLGNLPVHKVPGVGTVLQKKLAELGITHGQHVLKFPEDFFQRRFGKSGEMLYQRILGHDPRPVQPVVPRKSEGAEITLQQDTLDRELLKTWLFKHADRVGMSLRKQKLKGQVVTLKIKYSNFQQLTRQTRLATPSYATQTIHETAVKLLNKLELTQPVRLIGLSVSDFSATEQFLLLPDVAEDKRNRLDQTLDQLRQKFGKTAISPGRLLD